MVFPSLSDQLTLRARVLNCFACLRRRDTHFHSKPTQSHTHTHTHMLAHMHTLAHANKLTQLQSAERREERREGAVKTERAFNQPKKHSVLSSVTPAPPLHTSSRSFADSQSLLGAERLFHTHTCTHATAGTREQRCQRPREAVPTYLQYIFFLLFLLLLWISPFVIVVLRLLPQQLPRSLLWRFVYRLSKTTTIKINRKKENKKRREREFQICFVIFAIHFLFL